MDRMSNSMKSKTELSLLRQLEALIRDGIYDPPKNFEEHTEALHALLGDLDHVNRDEDGTRYVAVPAGSSALIVGPAREIKWVLDTDVHSESAAWVSIAVAGLGSEEIVAQLKADLFGNIEA